MSRLYLDACCLIYLIEGAPQIQPVVRRRLMEHGALPDAEMITSRLSRLECRTKPLKADNQVLLALYDELFASPRLLLAEISPTVIERATELRARYGLKTPDALHVATACEGNADVFLTGDAGLVRCQEIEIELVTEVA